MKHIIRATLVATAIVGMAPLAGAQTLVGRTDSVFTWKGALGARGVLTVKNFNGPVDVRPASGSQVEIRAEKQTERGGGDLRDVSFEVDSRSGDVTVCAVYRDNNPCEENSGRRRNDRGWDGDSDRRYVTVSMTVLVPRGAEVRVSTGNGAVSVEQVSGDLRASTGNGRVRVSNADGKVRVSTGNGDVDVRDSRAAVNVSTGNGNVTVGTTDGPVDARSGSGDINVTMTKLSSHDDMTFSTGNGAVRLTLPAGYNGELDASTGNGEIQSDFELKLQGRFSTRRIHATIGSGGSHLRMSTGNGRLEIRKA